MCADKQIPRLHVELYKVYTLMPELPDLQTFSQNLQKRLKGKKVVDLILHSKKCNVGLDVLKDCLLDQEIREIFREGKELRIKFSNEKLLGLHLMLHGELHISPVAESVKFSMFEMVLDDGNKFVLSDFQRQARPTLDPAHSPVPDALSETVDFKFLKDLLQSKKAIIKNVLLDQSEIRGIGNAYADEILWEAKLSPFSISKQIPDEAIKKLAESIKNVLKSAIKQIMKEEPDIISGEVRDFLKIHQSKTPESPTGYIIEVKKTGARKTYYTEEQVLYKV
jgi:formamidopyrimidine-DNA glycosylase